LSFSVLEKFEPAKVGQQWFKMLVDPKDTNIGPVLKSAGVWEEKATAAVVAEFTGGVFVDVGAHWGYYSMLAALKARRVYSFESDPYNFRYLQLNKLLNGFDNITAIPLIAWDETTTLSFSHNAGNTGNSGVPDSLGEDAVRIQAVMLDSILEQEHVDFIKVDAEGSDERVLKGAKSLLTRCHPKVMVEHAPVDYLNSLGYQMAYDVSSGQGPASIWKVKA
jgi:FkbM family methyltransferase